MASLLSAAAGHALAQTTAAVPGASEPPAASQTVEIRGKVERKEAEGYTATRQGSGTKTDTPILETPQSISVVTADLMRALGANQVVGALAYTAGFIDTGGFNPANETYSLRGFESFGGMFRDGLYYGGAWGSRQEPWGLERVEVLKGASSVMFGKVGPGGVVNAVSKQPTGTRFGEVEFQVGNYRSRQVALDAGAPFDGSDWSWRIAALVRDSGSQVDYVPNDREFIAPSLAWRPSAATSLTLLAQLQRSDVTFVNGLPVQGSLLPNRNGPLNTSLFTGEPGWDTGKDSSDFAGYLLQHQFNDALKLSHKLRYGVNKVHWRYSYIVGLDEEERTASRTAYDRRDRTATLASDTFVEWKLGNLDTRHTLIAGVDLTRINDDTTDATWSVSMPDLDLYAPVYGGPIHYDSAPEDWRSKTTQTGLYLQDQLKLGSRWTLLGGGRVDWVRYSDTYGASDRDRAFTGRLGAVYLADGGWAPFASFSQSFEPVSGYDVDGVRLKPMRGQQVELGTRWQSADAKTLVSLAAFQLTQTNVSTSDPTDPLGRARQIGEVRSRGIEVEASGRVGPGLEGVAAYAFLDSKVSKSLDASEVGKQRPILPRHAASLWLDALLDGLGSPGWKLGAGVRYIGRMRTQGMSVEGAEWMPSYSVVDLRASYASGPWRLSVSVNNVADKTYFVDCSYDACDAGARRTVKASVSYRW